MVCVMNFVRDTWDPLFLDGSTFWLPPARTPAEKTERAWLYLRARTRIKK